MATRKATTEPKPTPRRNQAPKPKRTAKLKGAPKPKRTQKPAGVPKSTEIRRDKYTDLFAECYAEFEASGYDTRLLNGLQLRIVDHFIGIAKAEGTPYNWSYKTWEHDWRMFLEYALRRIPEDDANLRELLMERVRNTWEQQRRESEHKHHDRLIERLEHVLRGTVDRAIHKPSRESGANVSIQTDAPNVGAAKGEERLQPAGTSFKEYTFGYVADGLLRWTVPLNQLAFALFRIEDQLGCESYSAGEVRRRIEAAGIIKLSRGQFVTVEKALEKIHNPKTLDFKEEEYVPEAAEVILSLLKK